MRPYLVVCRLLQPNFKIRELTWNLSLHKIENLVCCWRTAGAFITLRPAMMACLFASLYDLEGASRSGICWREDLRIATFETSRFPMIGKNPPKEIGCLSPKSLKDPKPHQTHSSRFQQTVRGSHWTCWGLFWRLWISCCNAHCSNNYTDSRWEYYFVSLYPHIPCLKEIQF